MGNFKVGDKVRIRDDLELNKYYGGLLFISSRATQKGEIGTIKKESVNGNYLVLNHWYSGEMLELYNESTFYVGDKVQIKEWDEMIEEYGEDSNGNPDVRNGFNQSMKYLCGEIATITKIDLITGDVELDIDTDGWSISLDMLKYVEKSYLMKDHSDDIADAIKYAVTDFVTTKEFIEKMKEEENMENEVLELWYERKNKELEKDKEEQFETFTKYENDILRRYYDLVEEFNDRFGVLLQDDKMTNERPLLRDFKIVDTDRILTDSVQELFDEQYGKSFDEKKESLRNTYREVTAQLSLSDDLEYQREVLRNYGILNKKNKISE